MLVEQSDETINRVVAMSNREKLNRSHAAPLTEKRTEPTT